MPRFRVTDTLDHDGRRYVAGDEVEMSQAQADQAARYRAVNPQPLGAAQDGESEGDDLTRINGISAARAEVLAGIDITTFVALAAVTEAEAEAIASLIPRVGVSTIAGWKEQAQAILEAA